MSSVCLVEAFSVEMEAVSSIDCRSSVGPSVEAPSVETDAVIREVGRSVGRSDEPYVDVTSVES